MPSKHDPAPASMAFAETTNKDMTTTGPPSDGDEERSVFRDDDDSSLTDPEHGLLAEEDRDEIKEVRKLAKRETRRVRIWKTILLAVVTGAATFVTIGAYNGVNDSEIKDYKSAYEQFSSTIKDAVQAHYSNHRLAMQSCSSSISGAAINNDETFPMVTLKDFEVLGASTRANSGIELLAWMPYVQPEQESDWISYSIENQGWINVSRDIISRDGTSLAAYDDEGILPMIYRNPNSTIPTSELLAPIWQMSPPPFLSWPVVNLDWLSDENEMQRQEAMTTLRHQVFMPVEDLSFMTGTAVNEADHEAFHARLVDWKRDESTSAYDHPHSFALGPVFEVVNDEQSDIVGQVTAVIAWDFYLVDLLPEGVDNITVTIRNTCNQSFSYLIGGRSAFYIGPGDLHEESYDNMEVSVDFYGFDDVETVKQMSDQDVCLYSFHIYPTKAFEDEYRSNEPMVLAALIGSAFLFMVVSFFMYDWFVQSRNNKVMTAAASSNAIISNMFPSQIRERLLEVNKRREQLKSSNLSKGAQKPLMVESMHSHEGRPIADFYPENTILFADLVGFTAWSSVHEPAQVFELLETVYGEFDNLARIRRVFKVETVGDCYVAVSGLPEPRKDHAIVMARFARDCLSRFQAVIRHLEVMLGPDTADLCMRFGLHSGPVTAGVLRGERARFQLFGDTMNTASRMESTGTPNMIQISQDTADLIVAAGKTSWVSPREGKIVAKGKGEMQTFWLSASRSGSSSGSSGINAHRSSASATEMSSNESEVEAVQDSGSTAADEPNPGDANRTKRLCQWNEEVMRNILRQIVAQRGSSGLGNGGASSLRPEPSRTPLDEVREVIELGQYSGPPNRDTDSIELDNAILEQLGSFVSTIASMYKPNPFHSFEHASHVTMAVVKLMSRVVNPKIEGRELDASSLHDYTFGITSDPLIQFACVFAAMVHDVDHPGGTFGSEADTTYFICTIHFLL
mmetsp:Transcript_5375/g.13548  ORF Transcript_5375/g.13548 Transcript_5375/m.13548 type:complete len:966 (+) Transcript_5375:122-3019(+)